MTTRFVPHYVGWTLAIAGGVFEWRGDWQSATFAWIGVALSFSVAGLLASLDAQRRFERLLARHEALTERVKEARG